METFGRFILSGICSAIPLAGSIILKFSVYEDAAKITTQAHVNAAAALVTMGLIWLGSVIISTKLTKDHPYETFFGSMVLPSVMVSAALGLQATV